MKNTHIAIFAVATAVILAAAVALQNRGLDSNNSEQALLPDLAAQIPQLTGLLIRGAGNTLQVELKKEGEQWVVANKSGYPADVAAIRSYLAKLTEAQVREVKTSSPDKYGQLGVEDLSDADAQGVGVELSGLPKPVALIAGTLSTTGGSGTYVRLQDVPETYLASGVLRPEVGLASWANAEVVNIGGARVQSVKITDPTGVSLSTSKANAAEANFAVADVPKGRELTSEFAGNALSTTIDNLRLEDVAKATEASPGREGWTAQYSTFDGVVVDVTHWRAAEKDWLHLSASVDENTLNAWIALELAKAQAERAATEANSAAEGNAEGDKPAPAPFDEAAFVAEKRQQILSEVESINSRVATWDYAIANWKAENIRKRIADLLKPKA